MGPPPHVNYELDEIMRVLEGTISVLQGDEVIEVAAGRLALSPKRHSAYLLEWTRCPAKFIDMYPSSQDFVHYLEELSQLGLDMRNEGVNPFAPENIARFKALDARYNHEVFYEQMPVFMEKYGPK